MQEERIIYNGHTPGYVWQELEQRSNQTQRKVTLRCPVCDTSIHHTETPQPTISAFAQRDDTDARPQLRCHFCDAPASLFQHSHHTETADTRIIYIEVKGQSREVARLKMQCLSCGQTLKTDETCDNTCWIQTYITLDIQDGEIYIKRWINCLNVKREIPEIPMHPRDDAPETDTADHNENQPQHQTRNQPNANAHTDIAGQILAHLTDAPNQTATTGEMIAAFDCSPEGFKKGFKKLTGRVKRIERGSYQLINP